ncbi:malate synthase G [Labrys neptuniae]
MPKPMGYDAVEGLWVHPTLRTFVEREVLPGTGVEPAAFWSGLAAIVVELAPRHREAVAAREILQARIDAYHREHKDGPHDAEMYQQFLRDIGYLVPSPAADAYRVATKNVDAELGTLPGPQLVVPLTDPCQALSAVNARWCSLYDALYGSDVIPQTEGAEEGSTFNPIRAGHVIGHVRAFLDQAASLARGSHALAASYAIEHGELEVTLTDGSRTGLASGRLAGFSGPRHAPSSIVLVNNGLHIQLVIDKNHAVGKLDGAAIADVVIEAVVSVVMDLEDTVAGVDAEDKVAAYRTWQRLMNGSLRVDVLKADHTTTLELAGDRIFTTPSGGTLQLSGRALMLVRNVGHHLFTDAVLCQAGDPVPEAIVDAAITVGCAIKDIRGENTIPNSRTGSVYVIKPKMHGPEEVGLSDLLFKYIEELFGLPKYTMKIGVMDEERRTSANLSACLSRVRDRTVLLNTGSPERVADEIRTSMEAGPVLRQAEMVDGAWYKAYQANSVDVGIARNLPGRAQIGRGRWTAPESMAMMMDKAIAHPRAGASTTWVPTTTAAALHAMHYHLVDVRSAQRELHGGQQAAQADLLAIPMAVRDYSADEIAAELESNLHSLLGYVVGWIGSGAGLSSIPDSADVRRTQDRATLAVASLHVANWLHHGIVSKDQVREAMRKMAIIVDRQNAAAPRYHPLALNFDGPAFKAAEDLVFKNRVQPNGYVEAILWSYRRQAKSPSRG